jgi:ribosomal protein L7/L12
VTQVQPPLPPGARAALDRGNKLEAIRLLREETGISLVAAKEAVEEQGAVVSLSLSARSPEGELPAHVLAALAGGQKIEAIKLLREATGLGLKEAKDAVDAAEARASLQAGLAPGEMRRPSKVGLWPWLAAGAVAVGAYACFNLR